jgi:hypothetical protein
MTNEQQQQQTHQNHQQRLARRRTSSTASLELNLLQDDEDGLEFELEASAIHNDNNTNNLSSEKDRQEQQVQQQQQQQQQQSSTSTRRDHVHYLSTLFAGVGSGALSSFICAPLDLIRTRMQVWGEIQDKQGNKKKITPGEAFRAIIKKEGPKGIFRGLVRSHFSCYCLCQPKRMKTMKLTLYFHKTCKLTIIGCNIVNCTIILGCIFSVI